MGERLWMLDYCRKVTDFSQIFLEGCSEHLCKEPICSPQGIVIREG
jgi:hypothetical protein